MAIAAKRTVEVLRAATLCRAAATPSLAVRRYTTTPEDVARDTQSRNFSTLPHVAVAPVNVPATSVTGWVSELVANTCLEDLSDVTVARSQRMLQDTLGVGYLGFRTEIAHTVTRCALESGALEAAADSKMAKAAVWGSRGLLAAPAMAAFLNGVSVHSMDFDDTWYPATHPSGPVLPAVLALAQAMTGAFQPSTQDVLLAYNVGIQVQGLLLRCSRTAREIPRRFHPPAVVGVMGSAAASSRLLGLGPEKCRHALAIAASFAGAPMANAGTTTKPLHAGKAARFGLEAALLADHGLEGNDDILDMTSGFGAFYDDYDPETFLSENCDAREFILHDQDVAIKRFPAHLGMHWAIDATMAARDKLCSYLRRLLPEEVASVQVLAPPSRYINRPLPSSEHEARHSFQFNVCTALLDGEVSPDSYTHSYRRRPSLVALLQKTTVTTPADNVPTFKDMYVEVVVNMKDGTEVRGRCETPYGHWRNPLSERDLDAKFTANTMDMPFDLQRQLMTSVKDMRSHQLASDVFTAMGH